MRAKRFRHDKTTEDIGAYAESTDVAVNEVGGARCEDVVAIAIATASDTKCVRKKNARV